MKTTGIIRKIDELGRIVIPKEIRNNLNIRSNNDIEIFVEEKDIILRRFSKDKSLEDEVSNYISIINEYFDFDVIITNMEKVIMSSSKNYEELVNNDLDSGFIRLLDDRKKVIVNNINTLNITSKFSVNTKYAVLPIIVDADVIGSFVIIANTEITNNNLLVINVIHSLVRKMLANN
ncbi:MAG: stage V sporulation T C-terminal domain-containing protein, partial [Bacilli bacterium]